MATEDSNTGYLVPFRFVSKQILATAMGEEFSARTLEFVADWMSLSESQKRECLKRLIKVTNWMRAEENQDYGFCFTCVYYKGKGKCRAGRLPVEANKRKQCGTWRVL